MNFWEIFKGPEGSTSAETSRLHQKISDLLPNEKEDELIKCACVAGLLARVAYIDFVIHENEIEYIKKALLEWTKFKKEEIEAISQLAIDEIKDLAGLENHLYTRPLDELMDQDERFSVVETLFALAASDHSVTAQESDEIRVINTGLRLEHKHFISARALVFDKLKALEDIP